MIRKYSLTSSQENPRAQSVLALMAVKIIGKSIGKPKTAVRVELLLVLAAMAETKVKVAETPKLPMRITTRNKLLFSSGFPKRTAKSNQLINAMRVSKMALKISFDNTIA